jgi:hypothetical protein
VSEKVDFAKRQTGPACLAADTLVSYLYDECASDERQRIEQHLTSCGACAAEVEGLGGTRAQLASWTPPDAALGFRVSAVEAAPVSAAVTPAPASVTRLPWWRQPMPAWAQAVAATVIFGLGMTAGSRQLPAAPATSGVATTPTVSAEQLSNLESRLRQEIAAMRTPSAAPVAQRAAAVRLDEAERDALMRQVRQMVRESEDRQQQAFTIRAAQVARDAEIQRQVAMANLRQTFEQMQGSTSEVQRQQGEMLKYLVNVSQRR